MTWQLFLKFLYFVIWRLGSAAAYGYFTFTSWSSNTICYERLSIYLFVIFIMGFEKSLTPTRFVLPNQKIFDFELTIIGVLIFISNDIEQSDTCMEDGDDFFLVFTEYLYYSILLVNCSFFFLYFLWILIYIFIRVFRYGESFSQQNLLVFHDQDLNANNSEGLNFHELNRLKQWKFNQDERENRNKTCSICLNDFENNENLIRLPECDHLFHNECIIDWLKGHIICPYCRCDIRAALEKENPLINRIEIADNIEN